MNYVICISGDGGGDQGPSGLFQRLKQKQPASSFTFIAYETIPSDLDENRTAIIRLITQLHTEGTSFYLVGWSLGAVVAIKVYQKLKKKHWIQGLILISPTSNYLTHVRQIRIPVGIIHGKKDQVVHWSVGQSIGLMLPNLHKIIFLDHCDHFYTGYIDLLYNHFNELLVSMYIHVSSEQKTDPPSDLGKTKKRTLEEINEIDSKIEIVIINDDDNSSVKK